MNLLITEVQRFSLYDGPGIRTTVFLKGCSLQCPWCCNPENIKSYPEFYFNKSRCMDCNGCVNTCPMNIINKQEDILKLEKTHAHNCFKCKKCVDICPSNALGVYGTNITAKNLLNLLKKDKDYYVNNGGITFSGGEPLLQAPKLFNILTKLKKNNIHIAIETSLFAPTYYLEIIEDLIDLFIIDIKLLDKTLCKKIIKGNLNEFILNVEKIIKSKKSYIFRFPLIKPFIFNEQNIKLLYEFIKKNRIKYLEIIDFHNLAHDKYDMLGLNFQEFDKLTTEEIENFRSKLVNNLKIEVNILKL